MATRRMRSFFGGRLFSTSLITRRSRCGRSSPCSADSFAEAGNAHAMRQAAHASGEEFLHHVYQCVSPSKLLESARDTPASQIRVIHVLGL